MKTSKLVSIARERIKRQFAVREIRKGSGADRQFQRVVSAIRDTKKKGYGIKYLVSKLKSMCEFEIARDIEKAEAEAADALPYELEESE